jgi:hypothetical protein
MPNGRVADRCARSKPSCAATSLVSQMPTWCRAAPSRVRETRRILDEYELTAEDVLTARKHDDVIARCTYPIDIHNPTGTGTVLRRLPPGEAYDIPLRALIPQQVELCWWPDAAFPAVMRPSPPTASCLSPWPWGRRLVSARPWRPEGSTPPRIEAVRVQQELRRQEADLRGCGG